MKKYFFPSAVIVTAAVIAACTAAAATNLHQPLEDAGRRSTPLRFGMHVTPDPESNPIHPPERFEGYHAAVDYEVGAEELEADVTVYAICTGNVLFSGFAEGYGGLLMQHCVIEDEDVTVLYGHLTLDGLPKTGTTLKGGKSFAILAPARSRDSDGNRKHLHLGIRKGNVSDVRGYVQNEEEIANYLDPLTVLPASPLDMLLPKIKPYWEGQREENAV